MLLTNSTGNKTSQVESVREKFFFLLYAAYEITYYIFGQSTINTFFNTSSITFSVNLLVIIGLTFFVATNKYDLIQFVLIFVGIIMGLYAYSVLRLNVLLITVLFMAAAKNIHLNQFIKKDFMLRTILLVGIILANRLGFVPSNTGLRVGTITIVRDSLGFGQFNITGALIMICVLEYVYLNFQRMTSLAYQWIVIIIVLTLALTNSRGSMLAATLYTLASWLFQHHNKEARYWTKKLIGYAKYMFGFLTVVSTIAVVLFSYKSTMWQFINKVTSDRINILNQYYEKFGIHILPQQVTNYRSAGIIVMDNIYVTLAIQYGLIVILLFVIYYYIVCAEALKKNNIQFILMLVALMIFGIIESSFFIVGINFTVMMIFSNMSVMSNSSLEE
ncbi:hypothetical protein EQK45_04850 [Lactiplantibacillus plantarum]|nr:hypothetical protein B5726_04845 [Lactiplantibacillus plantarum]MBO2711350.1 hypothetical protein [Lactiplantibacillus plantarum]MDN7041005.1 hypothetical protein [Lactiplantibacillus plantarum]QAR76495.1 hypothetical protein EQH94_10720 [Lactiplantibacillus plantarum]QAS29371.1 hypothetical protein EQK45_04850 [Lactiplantibacillus plantarum]